MVFVEIDLSESYWESLEILQKDIEFLYTFLLEKETPLPTKVLAEALVDERIRDEKEQLQKKQQQNGEIYLPNRTFSVGDKVQFPALNWVSGKVAAVREGNNPEQSTLKVITVELENGQTREFASNLEDHPLNQMPLSSEAVDEDETQKVVEMFGESIEAKLEESLYQNKDIVRIAANWFPKPLLITFNVGHLNLAEAVLDMHQGGPLPVDSLLEQIEIDSDDPLELVRFSLNYALQKDPRFDEVGPRGEVQWFLNRLEPEYVREKPLFLSFDPVPYDRSVLTEDMRLAEQNIADELVEPDPEYSPKDPGKEISIALIYPHWRTGSLPLTPLIQSFFPTALESPRVQFTMIDEENEEISAWVVRPYRYIYGLRNWYEEQELMPGSILKIKRGKQPGEVHIAPAKKRSSREWIRTLLIGADHGIVFATLKQTITADFNERMAIAVPAVEALDALWEKRASNPQPLKKIVINTMRELAKLNPQGQVHAIELYAALNCVRRCPPGIVFSILASNPEFTAVGDLYFRLSENG